MIDMNLQFFADGDESVSTGAEVSTFAESVETVGNDAEVTENVGAETSVETIGTDTETETHKRDFDRDSIYADARRKAEAEAKKRQADIDAEYVRRFGNYKNPITGEPIRSQADYLRALDAQEQARMESKLRESGVDANILQQFIDNNPAVRQAKEYLAEQQKNEAMRQIEADVAELSKIDPSITSFESVPREVVEMAQNRRMTLTESYKLLNYGKVTKASAEAMRQSAVNQIKGKEHLAPMNGVANNNTEVEIPSDVRAIWETAFPKLSYAEIRTRYNKSLK